MQRKPVTVVIGKREPQLRASVLYTIIAIMIVGATLCGSAIAQGIQQFVGHVADPSGAAIPGATVTIHNEDTAVDIVVQTTGAGDYTAPYLKPGTYTISAKLAGFKEVSKTHIHLEKQPKERTGSKPPPPARLTLVCASSCENEHALDLRAWSRRAPCAHKVQCCPAPLRNPTPGLGPTLPRIPPYHGPLNCHPSPTKSILHSPRSNKSPKGLSRLTRCRDLIAPFLPEAPKVGSPQRVEPADPKGKRVSPRVPVAKRARLCLLASPRSRVVLPAFPPQGFLIHQDVVPSIWVTSVSHSPEGCFAQLNRIPISMTWVLQPPRIVPLPA